MNRPWLFVHRRPRVGILSTGDEIVMPGDPIGPHQIVSSNGLALAAFVAACGGVAVSVGNAPDDRAGAAPHRCRRARAPICWSRPAAFRSASTIWCARRWPPTGSTLDFWQIAMRPGKPLMVGRYRGTPMLGLPGNPVSTLGLRPAVPEAGDRALERSGLCGGARAPTARLGAALAANDRRQDYLRARLGRADDGVEEVSAVRNRRTAR